MTETPGRPHRGSILVVDDVLANLGLLTDMLKREGYKVRPVPSSKLALRAAKNDPPDLILLDVNMPKMDGLEVCQELKTCDRTRDIPVIFISGLVDLVDRVRGFEVGGVDYIGKPFQAEEVLARVQTHLSLRRLQRQLQEQNTQLRDQAEALVRANAELARAARLKDEFLASMSHELRTPLNAILGLAETLQEGIYGPLNGKQLRSLQGVADSGRHLLALINDILDVAKIEAGKIELEITALPVKEVCLASLQLVKQQAHAKRVRVSSTFDSAVTVVRADERRLKQVLVNLLSNAVKFTPEGGMVGLEVVGDAEQEVARFTIWDTGIGISAEEMERLFSGPGGRPQPFVQLDSSLSRRYAGTGLGLALVYRLVDMHRGSISLESEVGKGSRFTISLPWQKPQAASVGGDLRSPSEPVSLQSGLSQSLILLAEDDDSNISVVQDYLSVKGYRVSVARNGVEAVQRAQAERPDLILMDIQMPEMDGLEASRRIRADPNLGTVPIVALTALVMPGDRERCLEAGANTYLRKPVSLRALTELIEVQLKHDKHG